MLVRMGGLAALHVLAEPRRLAILDLLRDGERPVGELVDRLGLSQPGVSKHLRVLRDAGLVEARHLTTFEDTVAHLLKRLTAGDLVLVKGSRGMRMERVVDALVARLARSGRERSEPE
jgi:DNA-binding transcriptional ArsR family regulator